ncbi:hypothetical protein AB0G79_02345 [Streptomyces sp. NPDC020807]|uniref:hypothetical protein n=1 Tax=Streptomyces sp. NPDC020807 TaxID=3155119 RepID=UPI0033D07EDF
MSEPEWVDDEARGPSRRSLLRTAGALLPALVPVVGGAAGTASAAGAPGAPRTTGDPRGAFSAPGFTWTLAGAPASGVLFALTGTDGLPWAGGRVRFSLSSFHTVRSSLWFEVSEGHKTPERLGYLDLDTDAHGAVLLDRWLRHGDVATAGESVLRAQLVGTETILATARLTVARAGKGTR